MNREIFKEVGQGIVSIFNSANPLSLFVTYTGVIFSWLFGSWDLALQILITFTTIDYVTGFLRGVKDKKLSSDVGLKGLLRKGGMLFVIVLAVLLDRLLENDTWVIRSYVAYFFIANEGISILENAASLGVPIPSKITDVLEQLKDGQKKGK